MGRRSSSMSLKLVLPTLSWVGLVRLLKKAPLGFIGIDAASKAFLGCGALPDTPSSRHPALLLPQIRRRPAGTARWFKPALLRRCASIPHTDSFRTHHVVNQEALQLVLSDGLSDAGDDTFYDFFSSDDEPPDCSVDGIIRAGDRLLHDLEGASASVMSACSSRLSFSTAGSISSAAFSAANTAFSGSSVDSEETHYSAASAGSLQVGPGNGFSCCSSPSSYCAGLATYGADVYSVRASASPRTESGGPLLRLDCSGGRSAPAGDGSCEGLPHADGIECGRHAADACSALSDSNSSCRGHDDFDVDEDDMGMVAQAWMSHDPLLDFEASIEELVLCHQLSEQPDRLHALYCRYVQLNPPCLHATIALAFFRTLQRLDQDGVS